MAVRASVALPENHQLSADAALHIAWWTWFSLLAFPFVLFLVVMWRLLDSDSSGNTALAQRWFIAAMIYIAIGVPLAFFARSRSFKGYWHGHLVAPHDYLVGMITVWVAIEIGGIFALIGCLVTGRLLPNLIAALLAFMLFTPLWPNGHSMTRQLHDERDPADYQDPR